MTVGTLTHRSTGKTRGALVALLALLASLVFISASSSAPSSQAPAAGPEWVTPADGEKIPYSEDLKFQVEPVEDSVGYLFGFFANGKMVWENYAREHKLSGTTYTLRKGSSGHSALGAGTERGTSWPLQVWARAYIKEDGNRYHWTDASKINVRLTQGKFLHPLSQSQFDQYCLNEGYEQGITAIGSDAESLRCVDDEGSEATIDVDLVCASAYPQMEVPRSRLRTMGATYTAWQCMDVTHYAGPPDFEAACKDLGKKLIFVGHPQGYSAYGWRCSPPVQFVPVTQNCKELYGANAIDRVDDVRSDEVEVAWGCYVLRKS